MKTYTKHWITCGTLVLALALAPALWAQENPFEVNGDVDNDGMVGITDVQQVINGALGLNDRGPDAVDLPLRQYIVASPRASLALLPGTDPASEEDCTTVGATTNFPRRNGRLLVRHNTGIRFAYDRNIEGVWHQDACGLLRSELIVEIRRLPVRTGDESNTEDTPSGEESPWVPIGRDGAQALTCGPAIGTANIGVRYRFEEAGDFIVRCTVRTFAIPEREVVEAGSEASFCGATRAVDQIFTHVRVVDRRATEDDLEWQVTDDANAIGSRFGTRLETEADSTVALP